MVTDLGACKHAPELMIGHVGKLVQLQLVGPVLFVDLVDMHHILLEHVESLLLLTEVPGHRVVAPPTLIEVPQLLLRGQILLVELKTLTDSYY